jgi:hypothetical protein
MSTVDEIKAAIPSLTLEERAEIARCLNELPDDDWDKQMKRDAVAGKFDTLNRQTDAEFVAGKTIPLEDILREP